MIKRGIIMNKKLPVLIALALILAGFTGVYAYQKPVSFVSLDINPSMELGVNVFDVVVSAKAYNNDGKKFWKILMLKGVLWKRQSMKLSILLLLMDMLKRMEPL